MRQVGDVLDGVLSRIGRTERGGILRVLGVWAEVAGPTWEERSRPVRLERGVLVVEVDDGLAASRLRFEAAALRRRLDEALGGGVITSVQLRTARHRGAVP
jgi:hypothetical protein